jgi:tRNA A-37 threonylcarbamoyl transferase component Bud32
MKPGSVRRFSKGEFKGWMKGELFDELPSGFFEDPMSFIREATETVIKDTRLRYAAIFTPPGSRRFFFKRDRTKGWFEAMKYLILPSKARKEWFLAHQLLKRKINVPKPMGWMEKIQRGFVKESYYFSEAVGSGVSLIEESASLGERFPLHPLAKTVKRMHEAGVFHKDLHAGNFLWDGESLCLIDLHSAKILRTLSLNRRLWNLSLLFHSLRSVWGEKDWSLFMSAYFEGDPSYAQTREERLQKVQAGMGRLQKRQWRSRTKRCLKESTDFTVQRLKGLHYFHRRHYPLERIDRALKEHLALLKENPSGLAKYSPKINVSILKDEGGMICVKQFRNLRFWDIFKSRFRTSKGLKAWVGGNGLRARGIPSLNPLALVEKRDWLGLRESFFLMEALENGQELDRYIFEGLKDFRKRRHFIQIFSQWLSRFHQTGLYHRDMKTCNLLISEIGGTWTFHLLDLEDLLLDENVKEKKLFKSFLQLNTSIPKAISRADRLRFLKGYTSVRPIIRDEKVFIRQLIQKSRERGIVYVSPQGVMEEGWS